MAAPRAPHSVHLDQTTGQVTFVFDDPVDTVLARAQVFIPGYPGDLSVAIPGDSVIVSAAGFNLSELGMGNPAPHGGYYVRIHGSYEGAGGDDIFQVLAYGVTPGKPENIHLNQDTVRWDALTEFDDSEITIIDDQGRGPIFGNPVATGSSAGLLWQGENSVGLGVINSRYPTSGQAYKIKIRQHNEYGWGPYSDDTYVRFYRDRAYTLHTAITPDPGGSWWDTGSVQVLWRMEPLNFEGHFFDTDDRYTRVAFDGPPQPNAVVTMPENARYTIVVEDAPDGLTTDKLSKAYADFQRDAGAPYTTIDGGSTYVAGPSPQPNLLYLQWVGVQDPLHVTADVRSDGIIVLLDGAPVPAGIPVTLRRLAGGLPQRDWTVLTNAQGKAVWNIPLSEYGEFMDRATILADVSSLLAEGETATVYNMNASMMPASKVNNNAEFGAYNRTDNTFSDLYAYTDQVAGDVPVAGGTLAVIGGTLSVVEA